MTNNNAKWFDVLMSRPRKKERESLTGLVIRLCDENVIASVDEASLLFFPQQSRHSMRFMQDYPPLKLSHLARISQIQEEDLRQGTFEPIASKFGRPTHPQALSRFLANTISPYLRVCPPCMATNPYHRITWRFAGVIGCLEHNCHLIDTCHNCGRKLPLFRSPFKVGRCPQCQTDLSLARPVPMNADEYLKTKGALEDIEFLFTPSECENEADEVIKHVGTFLMSHRETSKQSRAEFARNLGYSASMITGIELTRFSWYGATFPAYQAYARAFGLSLKDTFIAATAMGTLVKKPVRVTGQALVESVQSAIAKLSHANSPITGKAVADLVSIPRSTLIVDETIAQMIVVAEADRLRRVDEALKTRAMAFLNDLFSNGVRCSQDELAHHLGISRAKLRRSAELMALLRNRN